MHSLRARLFVLWLLSLVASAAVGVLLVQFYRQSTAAEVQGVAATVARACDKIAGWYAFYVNGWTGSAATEPRWRAGLRGVIAMALAREPGIQGGIWRVGQGSLAFAFPGYHRAGPGPDGGEAASIRALALRASRSDQTAEVQSEVDGQTVLIAACPLGGPVPDLAAWTMARVEAAPAGERLRLGLGLLLALMLGMTGWLTLLVVSWSRSVRQIATPLVHQTAGALPRIEPTGEPELDRIVNALNEAGARLRQAQARSEELAARAAAAERLATLGRVAAGVAHEIRDPIAAMRLKIENALAGDDQRRRAALAAVLGQIARLDRLVSELLAMTQRREPQPGDTEMAAFLASCAEDHHELAASRGVALAVRPEIARACFDAALIRRALDNLVLNAIQHTPAGGQVAIGARRAGETLRFEVADTGSGVAPEIAGNLFEPFVTDRPEGAGLGLAIVREIAEAHGGRAMLLHPGREENRGAVFALELPWRPC